MEVDKNIYPAVGFNFRVTSSDAGFGLEVLAGVSINKDAKRSQDVFTDFEPTQSDAAFQTISGITAKLNTETYQELGTNSKQIKLPGNIEYSDLELKRGLVKKGSNIGDWCNTFLTGETKSYSVSRKTINVFLLDSNSNDILITWTFFNCYPTEITVDTFDAMAGQSYAIETMKLSYSHFKKK
tara:strand:- start:1174 stop:1722 length:549 start_codon:yes stop_codon:yes gene_type:complete